MVGIALYQHVSMTHSTIMQCMVQGERPGGGLESARRALGREGLPDHIFAMERSASKSGAALAGATSECAGQQGAQAGVQDGTPCLLQNRIRTTHINHQRRWTRRSQTCHAQRRQDWWCSPMHSVAVLQCKAPKACMPGHGMAVSSLHRGAIGIFGSGPRHPRFRVVTRAASPGWLGGRGWAWGVVGGVVACRAKSLAG